LIISDIQSPRPKTIPVISADRSELMKIRAARNKR
jgi:hypothetical protein